MITFHVEPFSEFVNEAKPMFSDHWQELALNKDHVPLDPQYEVYFERERNGGVMVITAREDAKLCGYFIGFVAPGLHYRTCLTLTMDIFWVHPDHRGAGIGFHLFKAVEKEARRRGIQRMFVGSKLHKDASWLFEKLGYEEVERYYSLWMGQ